MTIGKDRRHSIGQDAFLAIERNHTLSIGKDRVEAVGNHRKDQTAANHLIEVGGHVEASVQGHHKLAAGQRIERRTQRYQLQAGSNVIIQGPGGTITLDESGVTIEGIAIRLKGPISQSSGQGNSLSLNGSPNAGLPMDALYDQAFVLLDPAGHPMPHIGHVISGESVREQVANTAQEGKTHRVMTSSAENLSFSLLWNTVTVNEDSAS